MKHTIFFSLALMVGMAAAQTAQQPSTNSPMQGTPQMQPNPSAAPTTPAAASESATSTLPAGATISAELTKSVDAKKALVLRTHGVHTDALGVADADHRIW